MRVTRENNRRLVDLLAEYGVGSVSMNAWQLGNYDGEYKIREDLGHLIPPRTQLVLSNQVTKTGEAMALPDLAAALASSIGILTTIAFSTQESDAVFVNKDGIKEEKALPAEFQSARWPIQTWTMSDWSGADRILFPRP